MMKYYSITTLSVFIVSPLLSLPLIIYGIYQQYKSSALFYALFIGLMAYLTAPVSDLYRHTLDYFSFDYMSWRSFKTFLDKDFLIQSLSFFFCKHNIPYDYVRLILLIVQQYIFVTLFFKLSDYRSYGKGKKEVFSRFVIWFLFSNFIVATLGVRFPLATSFYVLGCYYFLQANKPLKAIACFLLTVTIHFSMAYFIVALFALYKIPFKRRSVVICLIILSFIISQIVIKRLEVFFIAQGAYGADYLGDGQWGSGYKDVVSFKGLVYGYIMLCCSIPYYIYFYKTYDSQNKWCRWMAGALIMVAMFSSLETISSRVRPLFASLAMLYLLMMEAKGYVMSNRLKRLFLFFAIVAFLSNAYTNRTTIAHSRYLRMAEPVPLILSDYYTKAWIFTNVDGDGTIINK